MAVQCSRVRSAARAVGLRRPRRERGATPCPARRRAVGRRPRRSADAAGQGRGASGRLRRRRAARRGSRGPRRRERGGRRSGRPRARPSPPLVRGSRRGAPTLRVGLRPSGRRVRVVSRGGRGAHGRARSRRPGRVHRVDAARHHRLRRASRRVLLGRAAPQQPRLGALRRRASTSSRSRPSSGHCVRGSAIRRAPPRSRSRSTPSARLCARSAARARRSRCSSRPWPGRRAKARRTAGSTRSSQRSTPRSDSPPTPALRHGSRFRCSATPILRSRTTRNAGVASIPSPARRMARPRRTLCVSARAPRACRRATRGPRMSPRRAGAT